MADRTRTANYPGNALVAAFVFRILDSRGALRRAHVADAIRRASDQIPRRLIGDPRVATLCALRALLDDPQARRDVPPWLR